jgi:spore germination protein
MNMRWRQWLQEYPGIFWAVVVVAAFLVFLVLRSTVRGPAAPMPGIGAPRFQVVGFYENTQPSSLASFEAHWRQITTVTPRWFSVTGTGTVTDLGYDPSMAAFARAHHILLVPLVNNAAGTSNMLWTASTRARAAANLAQVVSRDHLDGLNIDFELLNPSARADLTDFVATLRKDLPAGKVLAVSVFPLLGVPTSVNGADDYAGLARSANYLVVMTYDHHYDGGPPGPVAPYGWVAQNIAAAVKQVPASKLMLAIGMYGYDWVNNGKPGPAASLSDIQAKALAAAHGVTPQYVADISQNTFTYSVGGVSHVVWYMGDRSAEARARLARADHLAGVGLWRLGYEDPGFWPRLQQGLR